MKLLGSIVSIFILVIVSGALGFYLYQSHWDVSKAEPSTRSEEAETRTGVESTEPRVPKPTEVVDPTPTAEVKKGCACCRDEMARVKATRKALEMWAREMIATHGYDQGMKRVTAKSPGLAKRVQALLEKEKKFAIVVEGSQ